jgi:hypothetical protein
MNSNDMFKEGMVVDGIWMMLSEEEFDDDYEILLDGFKFRNGLRSIRAPTSNKKAMRVGPMKTRTSPRKMARR